MNSKLNPFLINNYLGPEYFCDREKETKLLIKNICNQTNTAIFAQRRSGKSALIKHVFQQLKTDYNCIYIDLFSSSNLGDFANLLANSIYKSYKIKKKGQIFLEKIKLLRPVLSINELTGSPEITLDFSAHQQVEKTVPQLLRYIDGQGINFVIAFDEFQQIMCYPEKNVEAILRSCIQELKNCQFIFCGSHLHLMNELFHHAKRPFYASCSNLFLGKIPSDKYLVFAQQHFEAKKRILAAEAMQYILTLSHSHTYYVQKILHELFATQLKSIGIEETQHTIQQMLQEQEMIFFQYRSLLTTFQWELLSAIAKEDKVYQPYANDFVRNYRFTVSNIKRALNALTEKGMVFYHSNLENPYYEVQDKLLKLWLKYK
jgi:AAA+ ATPase superfamily predicted ATPase